MPYISKDQRFPLDELIVALAERIHSRGELNYTITRLVLDRLGEPTYSKIEAAIGTLECVKQELYRRVGVPYEETKRQENGEVF